MMPYFIRDGTQFLETSGLAIYPPDPRFSTRGSLQGWQSAIGRVARKQPFFLAALATALVGMRFCDTCHPEQALSSSNWWSPPYCGKSTAALAAASYGQERRGNPLGGADRGR